MSWKTEDTGLTRRNFVKTVGLAGIAVAGTGVPGALAAPEPPAATAPAGTTPKRKLGKTGVEVFHPEPGGHVRHHQQAAASTAGAQDATLQERGLSPEVPLNPRRRLQHFQRPTPSHVSQITPRATRRSDDHVARGRRGGLKIRKA